MGIPAGPNLILKTPTPTSSWVQGYKEVLG
jgi:hypothetical protein